MLFGLVATLRSCTLWMVEQSGTKPSQMYVEIWIRYGLEEAICQVYVQFIAVKVNQRSIHS